MCPEDEEYKGKVEIIPPPKGPREPEPKQEIGQLPAIQLPPRGLVRLALYTAIKYKMTSRAIDAYMEAVQSLAGTKLALSDLGYAELKLQRTVKLLEDAESIHDIDAWFREQEHIKAETSLKDAQAKAEIADMKRERLLAQEEEKHRRWQEQQQGGEASFDLENLSEAEQEFAAELQARMHKELSQTEKVRAKEIVEALIAKHIRERGGPGNLTPDEHESIKKLRDEADKMVKQSEKI